MPSSAFMQETKLSRASHPCLLSPRQAVVSIVTSGPEPRQLVLRPRPAEPSMCAGAGAAEEAGWRQRLSEEGSEQALALVRARPVKAAKDAVA
jgi:hypothetical protein